MEQAKESMAENALAIRMQTKNFIDKRQGLLADAHTRCEEALAAAHTRMKDVSRESTVLRMKKRLIGNFKRCWKARSLRIPESGDGYCSAGSSCERYEL